jgi:hypothetical protein
MNEFVRVTSISNSNCSSSYNPSSNNPQRIQSGQVSLVAAVDDSFTFGMEDNIVDDGFIFMMKEDTVDELKLWGHCPTMQLYQRHDPCHPSERCSRIGVSQAEGKTD